MSAARILVVDDQPAVVELVTEVLTEAGYRADGVTSGEAALAAVADQGYALVVSDVEMPGMRGPALMTALHAAQPDLLVLLMTAFGSVELAVEAVRAGACDFISKPFDPDRLVLAVQRALRERQMRREIVKLRAQLSEPDPHVVARSPAMRRVVTLAQRAARSDVTVLITGESGVGKNVVAGLIHRASPRASGPYLQLNCAALPDTLVEAELFGVRKGAFTDAREDRDGLLHAAHGGTLFLDEIAEMPLGVQPKLLHALETRAARPVGATRDRPFDTRLVAATNAAVEQAVEAGHLRADLYYRLNVVRIEVPPLRARPEDVEPLFEAFLSRACAQQGRALVGVSAAAWRWLRTWHWPGNVRELANTATRAVALAEHDTLTLDDVRPPAAPKDRDDFLAPAVAAGLSLRAVEDAYIERTLRACGGNKVQAAARLGIDRRTLYRRLDGAENVT